MTFTPPPTRREIVTDTLHGVQIDDPYRWLEDQRSEETRDWLNGQIQHTQAVLATYPGRDALKSRLAELMRTDSVSLPVKRGGAYFYTRRLAAQSQHVICMRASADDVDRTLIDPHLMDPDGSISVSIVDLSHDASLMAYSIRYGGEDEVEIRFFDIAAGADTGQILPKGRYFGVDISKDLTEVYYSINTPEGPRVRVHLFGTDIGDDEQIFGEGIRPDQIVGVNLSEDGRYLTMIVFYGSSGNKTDVYLCDLEANRQVRTIVDNIDGRFYASIAGDSIYLQTNWLAPNCRLFRAPLTVEPNSPDCWREIVPARENAVLQNASPVGGKIWLNYLENICSRIACVDPDGAVLPDLPIPGIGSISGPYGDWDDSEAFYSFSSFVSPGTSYCFDCESLDSRVWWKPDLPVDTDQIEVKQAHFASKDGTRIPMFLVHRKGLVPDGQRPVYMTGYGGFNLSRTPYFSALAAVWAERGGVFALVNLRGGGEFGEGWHRAGMLDRKQNVFDDLYASAEYLIESGYTNSRKIAVAGRSNGGLLVGAAITQRPDLFGAAICGYPLLDMIRYHQFLVAGYWVPEYGSSDNADQFRYLLAYSPYHNVKEGVSYPAVMFMTGDSDTRVDPLHARKMAARMQAAAGPDRPILLHYDVQAGHSDGKPINEVVEDTADEMLFALKNLGEL